MPSNLLARTSCSIYPTNHPTLPAGLPSQEYKHHAFKASSTGAIQEIVTIESCEDTSFEVKLDIHPCAYSLLHNQPPSHPSTLQKNDYLIYVRLDGIDAQRSKRHHSQVGPTRISGVFSRDYKSSRTFQFGKLQLVDPDDDNRICQDSQIIQALGTIQVNIVRCTLGPPKAVPSNRVQTHSSNTKRPSHHPRRADRFNPETLRTTNQMIFSERSKKACQVNSVGLGNLKPASTESFHTKKTIRPVLQEDPNPFLQFIFKYKPRSILEAEGIIAPPPPPPRSPSRNPRLSTRDRTCQTSVKNEASNNHDYLSSPDHHQSSHDRQVDEKKPKCKTEPKYILIDSDHSSDCSETEAKHKLSSSKTNGHPHNNASNAISEKHTCKSEINVKDENRPPHADHSHATQRPNSDSKKRTRSSTAMDEHTNKRRSSITTDSNIHQNGKGPSRSSNNKINLQTNQISDLKFRTNNVCLDLSSDEDESLGSARAKSSKDDLKDSKNKHRMTSPIVVVNNSRTRHATATTQNSHRGKSAKAEPEKKINPAQFFDLTELDSDSD